MLTHFHADHVDGLAGVVDGRRVGAIETTPLADPPDGVADVAAVARRIGLVPARAPYGVTRTVGDLTLQVLWPTADAPTVGPGDGSTANNASVVLLAEVRGVRLLLSGDIEPEGQAALARAFPGLGSTCSRCRTTAAATRTSTCWPRSAPGSPSSRWAPTTTTATPRRSTLAALAATGARVLRTDLDGDLVVVERDGRLAAVTRR